MQIPLSCQAKSSHQQKERSRYLANWPIEVPTKKLYHPDEVSTLLHRAPTVNNCFIRQHFLEINKFLLHGAIALISKATFSIQIKYCPTCGITKCTSCLPQSAILMCSTTWYDLSYVNTRIIIYVGVICAPSYAEAKTSTTLKSQPE